MSDVLIMTIIYIIAIDLGIVAFSAVLLWIGTKLMDMEAKRENEGICK